MDQSSGVTVVQLIFNTEVKFEATDTCHYSNKLGTTTLYLNEEEEKKSEKKREKKKKKKRR